MLPIESLLLVAIMVVPGALFLWISRIHAFDSSEFMTLVWSIIASIAIIVLTLGMAKIALYQEVYSTSSNIIELRAYESIISHITSSKQLSQDNRLLHDASNTYFAIVNSFIVISVSSIVTGAMFGYIFRITGMGWKVIVDNWLFMHNIIKIFLRKIRRSLFK